MAEPKYKQVVRAAEAGASEARLCLHLIACLEPDRDFFVADRPRLDDPFGTYRIRAWSRNNGVYFIITERIEGQNEHLSLFGFESDVMECLRRSDLWELQARCNEVRVDVEKYYNDMRQSLGQ